MKQPVLSKAAHMSAPAAAFPLDVVVARTLASYSFVGDVSYVAVLYQARQFLAAST